MERKLGTQKIAVSLSTTQLGVSPAMFHRGGLKQKNWINTLRGKKCPKRVPENRDPKFNQAVQWWLALAMRKEGGFPLLSGLSSSLHPINKGSYTQRYAGKYLTTSFLGNGGREVLVGSICQFPWCKTPTVVHLELSIIIKAKANIATEWRGSWGRTGQQGG